MKSQLEPKNSALAQFDSYKGSYAKNQVEAKKSIDEQTAANAEEVGANNNTYWENFHSDISQKKMIWTAGIISLLVIVAFVLLVRFKVVKF